MKTGFMGWLQLPKPWDADSEYNVGTTGSSKSSFATVSESTICGRLSITSSKNILHSSAGESFLAACSQRTKRIRLGSGICLLPPNYNHPARVAERVAALDLMSNGRAEFGTGESTSFTELDAFHVSRTEKRAMWRESLGVICRMMVEEPFRGAQGKYFNMPPRNVIPKPRQKPHPPVWVACSRQETIMTAAKFGIGALTFGFVRPRTRATGPPLTIACWLTRCPYLSRNPQRRLPDDHPMRPRRGPRPAHGRRERLRALGPALLCRWRPQARPHQSVGDAAGDAARDCGSIRLPTPSARPTRCAR